MSHRLHHTEGLILARRNYGEANVFYQILTPNLGLINVGAQGVRYLKSKLRSQLKDLDYVSLTLVRGREMWRLAGAEAGGRLEAVLTQPEKRRVWARVASLVRRLMPGEQGQPELFSDLCSGLEALGEAGPDKLASGELILVLRLLHILGYVKDTSELSPWLARDIWREQNLALGEKQAGQLLVVINSGLAHSQL